jgi:hypothetical protein
MFLFLHEWNRVHISQRIYRDQYSKHSSVRTIQYASEINTLTLLTQFAHHYVHVLHQCFPTILMPRTPCTEC